MKPTDTVRQESWKEIEKKIVLEVVYVREFIGNHLYIIGVTWGGT